MSREGANTAHRALVGNYPHCTDVKTECQKKTKALNEAKSSKDWDPGPERSSVGFLKAAGTTQ